MKPIVMSLVSSFIFMMLLIWIQVRRNVLKYQILESTKHYRTVYYDFFDPKVVKTKKTIAAMDLTSCLHHTVCVDQVENSLTRKTKKLETVSFTLEK